MYEACQENMDIPSRRPTSNLLVRATAQRGINESLKGVFWFSILELF